MRAKFLDNAEKEIVQYPREEVKMKVSLKNRRTNSMVYKNEVKSMTERHQKYLGNRNDQKKKKKEKPR